MATPVSSTELGYPSCLLFIVGLCSTAYIALILTYKWLRAFRVFATHSGLQDTCLKTYGEWAVITGATDGIGKAYAEQLAAKGLNIVLISRSLAKLQAVSSAIETAYNVETKIIAVDFTQGMEIYSKIGKQLVEVDIGVLVNNVATNIGYPEYFHLTPNREEQYAGIINCNVLSVTQMTSLVLPGMLKKKKGVIINISSVAASLLCPLVSYYSATKSFVSTFTKSLQVEYASQGILIQLLTPGYVMTNLSKLKESGLFAPTPTVYVRSALATLGAESETHGYFFHWLMSAFVSVFIPAKVSSMLTMRIMSKERAQALQLSARKSD